MLFRDQPGGVLAISQPMHAWVAGQILAQWRDPLDAALLLAAAQHDVAWLDWELAPDFDPATGRPALFRAVGAAVHAPMWIRGVERARAAWGLRPALLISRHGGVIYRRFTDRHRQSAADADAAEAYLRTQSGKEATWADALGLDAGALSRDTGLIACADTLSLVFCGELAAPRAIEAPDLPGGAAALHVAPVAGDPFAFTIDPWPFRSDRIEVSGEGRPLPLAGRFAAEAEMHAWLAADARAGFRITARKLD